MSKYTTVFLLLLFSGFGYACYGQNTRTHNVDASVPQQNKLIPVEDPYFVRTRDTFSEYGPRSITRNLLQDRSGKYWFASWQGIMSYDGRLFVNHTLKEGLRQFHAFSVMEDRKGNLWFGTIGGGVYLYDGKSFTNITTANGLVNNVVTCMLEDNAGQIWFGTQDGVTRYDPKLARRPESKALTNFTSVDGLSSNDINTIAQDKTGRLWFGTRNGVDWYSPPVFSVPGTKAFTAFTNEKYAAFNNVRSIIEDKDGRILIGGADGLSRYDPEASARTSVKTLTTLCTNFIGYIYEDRAENLWLSEGIPNTSRMSLTRFDGKSFTNITSRDMLFGIYEDREGKIWFGSVYGVIRYDPSASTIGASKQFYNFRD